MHRCISTIFFYWIIRVWNNTRMDMRYWGKVRSGTGAGKRTGFPTANVLLHKAIPAGIYISETKLNGLWRPSVTCIGAQTGPNGLPLSETYLFEAPNQFYGSWITNRLHKKIRGVQSFKSPLQLKRAIQRDIQHAEQYFT